MADTRFGGFGGIVEQANQVTRVDFVKVAGAIVIAVLVVYAAVKFIKWASKTWKAREGFDKFELKYPGRGILPPTSMPVGRTRTTLKRDVDIKSGGLTRLQAGTTTTWGGSTEEDTRGADSVVAAFEDGGADGYPFSSTVRPAAPDGDEDEDDDDQDSSLLPGSDDLLDKVGGTIMPTVVVTSGVSQDLSGRAVDFPNAKHDTFWNNSSGPLEPASSVVSTGSVPVPASSFD